MDRVGAALSLLIAGWRWRCSGSRWSPWSAARPMADDARSHRRPGRATGMAEHAATRPLRGAAPAGDHPRGSQPADLRPGRPDPRGADLEGRDGGGARHGRRRAPGDRRPDLAARRPARARDAGPRAGRLRAEPRHARRDPGRGAPLGGHGRGAVAPAPRDARLVAGPWGAFTVVDVAAGEELRAILLAPWEGRPDPSPAELNLFGLHRPARGHGRSSTRCSTPGCGCRPRS